MKNLNLLQKKWYVIDSQTAKDKYNPNNSITFASEIIKSSLCEYSDTFILVTRDITVAAANDTHVAFKNCAPYCTCKIEINDVFIDEVNHIYIAMPMYNLIKYSNNHADTSGSLWDFKRDEPSSNNADFTADNSESFKCKAALAGKTAGAVANTNSSVKAKIVVPLKYLSNFWRSLEMPLINCKIHLELNWIGDCILSSAGDSAK